MIERIEVMRITIAKKLLGGFLLILILLLIESIISSNTISNTEESYEQLLQKNVESAILAQNLENVYLKETNTVRNYLLTGDESYIDIYKEHVVEAAKLMEQLDNIYETPQGKEAIQQLLAFQQRFEEIVAKEIAFKQQGNTVGYTNLLNTSGKTISNVFQGKIEQLVAQQEIIVAEARQDVAASVDQTKQFVIILSIFSLMAGLTLAIVISRSISNPIKQAAGALRQVAQGDLRMDLLKVKNKDEVGDLVESFNTMVQDLQSVVAKIHESSASVASSSTELAANTEQSSIASKQVTKMTQDSAEGNERQLAQYQELIQSVSEMNDGIHQVTENSEEMIHLTENASLLTKKGEEFIDHVVNQMNLIQNSVSKASGSINSLSDRSNEISKITEIITSVAEQTNLLALNAAIEAARAGEHGKGFAVVADEVKKLAEESRKSAIQITEMISQIQQETKESVQMMEDENAQVKQGLKETEEANKAFKMIAQSMQDVNNKVVEVSAAVQQMTAISSSILQTVTDAKEIARKSVENTQESAAATQQQYASLEEVASSAQFLSVLADELQSVISKFKLNEQGAYNDEEK